MKSTETNTYIAEFFINNFRVYLNVLKYLNIHNVIVQTYTRKTSGLTYECISVDFEINDEIPKGLSTKLIAWDNTLEIYLGKHLTDEELYKVKHNANNDINNIIELFRGITPQILVNSNDKHTTLKNEALCKEMEKWKNV